MKESITLLDGYSLMYRTYFAFIKNPLINRKGENVSIIYGFFNALFNYLEKYQPKRFAVILDSRTKTFRHEMYSEYKANREKAPEDLHSQIPIVEEILAALEIPIFRQDGMEADDIIATFATACTNEKIKCKIITKDKDLLQLVSPYVSIMKPDKGKYIELNKDSVIKEWGVEPHQILELLALTGDTADNIPGVMGIGPKTAGKMLSSHSTLEEIYENLSELTPSIKKKMEAGKENAFLSRKLVKLKTDLNFKPHQIENINLNRDAASPIFLREEVASLATGENKTPSPNILPPQKEKNKDKSQTEIKQPEGPGKIWKKKDIIAEKKETLKKESTESITDIATLKRILKEASNAERVAFDIETNNIDEMKAKPVGFSLSFDGKKGWYAPLTAGGIKYLPEDETKAELIKFFKTPNLKLIGQNFKYDYKILKLWNANPIPAWADTMIAAWLIGADLNRFNMDSLADRYLNYKTIEYKDIVSKKETFESVSLETATQYAAEDAIITYRLWEKFAPMLKSAKLEDLFFKMEMPLSILLADIEMEGIWLDKGLLAFYSEKLSRQLGQIEKEIWALCGKEFNIKSTKQLQEVLFTDRGLKPIRKTKTGYSTDTTVLQVLSNQDPVASLILRHRGLAKLKSTYTDSLAEMIQESTGRLHTHLIQTGTATGRLSSRDPNLQNIPIRDEEGRMIRKAFRAGKGKIFLSADYSQIELAVLASLSGDKELCTAFKTGEDIHRRTAALIFNEEPTEVTSEQRRAAKTINFGVMYGMSSFRLSQSLKIPMKQANLFIQSYFTTYNGINQFIKKTIEQTEKDGYVSTAAGHIRRIQGINSRNKTEKQGAERITINTPIQGTAADIMKRAMLAVSKRIKDEELKAKLVLQIHDELLFELPTDELEKLTQIVREEMERVTELKVPVKITIESGQSWGDFH